MARPSLAPAASLMLGVRPRGRQPLLAGQKGLGRGSDASLDDTSHLCCRAPFRLRPRIRDLKRGAVTQDAIEESDGNMRKRVMGTCMLRWAVSDPVWSISPSARP